MLAHGHKVSSENQRRIIEYKGRVFLNWSLRDLGPKHKALDHSSQSYDKSLLKELNSKGAKEFREMQYRNV